MSSNKKQNPSETNVDVDSTSDSDVDPFDFVAQYKRLEKKRKMSKMKSQPVNDHPPVVNDSTTSTEINCVPSIISEAHSNISQIKKKTSKSTGPKSCKSKDSQRRNGDTGFIVGPVICIGDFDDGYDIPPLGSSTVCSKPINNEEDDYCYEVLNRQINVGVYWRKTRVHRFPIRMFQSIESIYEHFAKLENIHTSHVSLTLKKKCLSPTDSPYSMNYKVTDFIDGDIEFYKSPYDTSETTNTKEEEVTFRIKRQDVKCAIPMSIRKTDRMCILYLKLAEKLALDVESFTLEFDGDVIQKSDTIESLDLEGDECFDLFPKKK